MLLTDPLNSILGQASKVRILRFLARAQAELNGREIARAVGLSHVKCHTVLQEFSSHGLVTMRRTGRSVLYRPEMRHVLFEELLTPLFNAESLLTNRLAVVVLKEMPRLKPVSLILFGSAASRRERPDSDLDVLIVVRDRKSAEHARRRAEEAQVRVLEKFGNRLAPIVVTVASFRAKVRKGQSPYAQIASTGRTLHGKSPQEIVGNAG